MPNPVRVRVLVCALAVALVALVALAAVAVGRSGPVEETAAQVTQPDPGYSDVEWLEVRAVDDAAKAGDVHSVIGQRLLTMPFNTCGVSGDQLRFRFDQPAELLAVDISVDIGPGMDLVEVLASLGAETGYEAENRAATPLLHTSWDSGDPAIDKATAFPLPVAVAAGDWVTVGAWLCSGFHDSVSPEVTLFYRWL